MIKKIGNYYLTQDINSCDGLKEFSDEEYKMAEQGGLKRMFDDEKMFDGLSVEFASIQWEFTTIGSIRGKIYKIALQLIGTDKRKFKGVLNTVVDYINKEIGKFNEHPFLSDNYIWDTPEGNIYLNRRSQFNTHAINLIFTSSIIGEQF